LDSYVFYHPIFTPQGFAQSSALTRTYGTPTNSSSFTGVNDILNKLSNIKDCQCSGKQIEEIVILAHGDEEGMYFWGTGYPSGGGFTINGQGSSGRQYNYLSELAAYIPKCTQRLTLLVCNSTESGNELASKTNTCDVCSWDGSLCYDKNFMPKKCKRSMFSKGKTCTKGGRPLPVPQQPNWK
jgi:hypothetical protein